MLKIILNSNLSKNIELIKYYDNNLEVKKELDLSSPLNYYSEYEHSINVQLSI